MRHFFGYLALTTPDGDTTELVNGVRALALMDIGCRAHATWERPQIAACRRWLGQECWAMDSAQYGLSASSWANPAGTEDQFIDAADPRSDETAGFLPDAPGEGIGIILESPDETRVAQSPTPVPLELIVTGTVIASSIRGEHLWLQWASRALNARNHAGLGWTATLMTHCPDQTAWSGIDPTDLPALANGEPARTTWDDPSHPTLAAAAALPWPLDSGLRQLHGVKFVAIDPIFDQPLFGHEVGRRYAIRFTVDRHEMHDRPRIVGTAGGSGNWASGEAYPLPLEPSDLTPNPDGFPGLAVPPLPTLRSGVQAESNRWRQPDQVLRESVLTPPLPERLQRSLIITVTNPSATKTVYNARVRVWDAVDGEAPPDTQVGDAFYRDVAPVAEVRIARLDPLEAVKADARTGRVTLIDATGTTVANVSNRSEGLSPPAPTNVRQWVSVDMSSDAGSYGDLDLELRVDLAECDEAI